MKPDWDKLMEAFKDSKTVVVADVECSAEGKSMCSEVGVKGYPTIKYGNPDDLQDYKGGRSFADLKKFAEEMKPMCGPTNLDACDDTQKKQIEEWKKIPPEVREAMVAEKEEKIKTLEADGQKFIESLNKKWKEYNDKKEKAIEEIKASGLGLLKSVHLYEKKMQKAEL
eukprot:CAMPEP_0168380496 /NCGR_PEP_ID=MMETSP0228-20121227/12392_1 /TAXON_ID=133427 /ORGANISM="Protoceratium reticulatum, Strain CCCM 535 (=CCMP 1889)" /LENGTH=168 /DNA_ID=CAMNT_0008393567 /DNA_START=78 /DNA_END=584 /DNA_ORIENTATION=-